MNSEALPIGVILDKKYHIKEIKGQGGFGITYIADFPELKSKVAIKECFLKRFCKRENNNEVHPVSISHDNIFAKYKDKFLEEAQQIKSFEHPNIIKINNFIKENNTVYYVMDYVQSVTLYDLVNSRGCLSETDSIHYIKQIAEALQVVHEKKILHRDVKPNNILIKDNTDAILIDFGAAREIFDSSSDTIIVTEGYASPEQYHKNDGKSYPTDIYGLGATLYYCVTGQTPISAIKRTTEEFIPPIKINPTISQSINRIIIKAMSILPEERYPNISALLYDLTTATVFDPNEHVVLTNSQKEGLNNIKEFLVDINTQIFILSGAAYSGKSHLIHLMIEAIQKNNAQFKLLTIGSRLAETIRNKNKLESITSIYPLLYNFNNQPDKRRKEDNKNDSSIDEEEIGKITFGIKENDDPADVVYIVDEAHLLSDHFVENDLLIFGSGMLLKDFLLFVNLKKYPNRKIIFIGDDKRILRGSKEESAMSKSHLEISYEIKVRYYDLQELVQPRSYNAIYDNGLKLRAKIEEKFFNELQFTEDSKMVFKITSKDFKNHFSSLPEHDNAIVINFSNKQVSNTNNVVREILGKKNLLDIGDRVITFNRFNSNQIGSTYLIHRGEYGEIVWVDSVSISKTIYLRDKSPINLTFRKVKIIFRRIGATISTLILENFLASENTKLSAEERLALVIIAKENVREKNPDKKLKREEMEILLKADEFYNTALIKYGYAITCHRAQGYQWPYVYVNFENEQGKDNKNYFSWCYSAITRAMEKVFLIDPPVITPFIMIHWRDNAGALDTSLKIKPLVADYTIPIALEVESTKFNFPIDKPFLKEFWAKLTCKLKSNNIIIERIDHNQYQEIYHFKSLSGERAKIVFSYNGKNEFTKNTPQPINDFTRSIITLISIKDKDEETYEGAYPSKFTFSFLEEFYDKFRKEVNSKGINVYSYQSLNYQDKFTLYKNGSIVVISVFYNGQGFISSIYPEKVNSLELLEEIKVIFSSNFLNV